jgi:hypothetical protein
MSDVFAIFGTLLALGIAFPGLLAAWWLLFPGTVERSRLRLEGTPWRCFWLGGIALAAASIPIAILLALPFGPSKLFGSLAISALLAVASLGAAGLAALMGARLAAHTGSGLSPAAAFLRGALALELAAAFPVIGWLIVIPLAIVTALGAAAFALLRWVPRVRLPAPAEQPAPAEELA